MAIIFIIVTTYVIVNLRKKLYGVTKEPEKKTIDKNEEISKKSIGMVKLCQSLVPLPVVSSSLAPTLVATVDDSLARNVPREMTRLTIAEAQVIVNTDDNFWANVDSDEFFDNFEERKSRAAYRINQAGFEKNICFIHAHVINWGA